MADFTDSGFWNLFIIVMTLGGILAMYLMIVWLSSDPRPPGETVQTMGHVWDEDLQELNNPLPRWWLNLFLITLVFGVIYLLLYPGLGTNRGVLGWSQVAQYEDEVDAAAARYGPLFEQYRRQPIERLVNVPDALAMGERLYATYCTGCHGSDAGGGPGYPNLRDADWLYGGEPAAIQQSILDGRQGVMPGWESTLGAEGVKQAAQYVMSLSGQEVDAVAASAGRKHYEALCVACHMADGEGNPALGAPDLTDTVWLYGGSARAVEASIAGGRQGVMPPHRELLGEAKAHLLAAYIYSLSR